MKLISQFLGLLILGLIIAPIAFSYSDNAEDDNTSVRSNERAAKLIDPVTGESYEIRKIGDGNYEYISQNGRIFESVENQNTEGTSPVRVDEKLKEKLSQAYSNESVKLLVYLKLETNDVQKELSAINSKYDLQERPIKDNIKMVSSKYYPKVKESIRVKANSGKIAQTAETKTTGKPIKSDSALITATWAESEGISKEELRALADSGYVTNLSENDLFMLAQEGKKLEDLQEAKIAEITSKLTENNEEIQSEFAQWIETKGGKVKNSFAALNILAVEAPADLVEEIVQRLDVISVELDINRIEPKLDVSVPTLSASTWWSGGYKGSWVDVAVVDSGVDNAHPALSADSEGASRTFIEKDFTSSGTTVDDEIFHGTHVAGIIASSDSTYRGVSPGVDKLINAKHLGGVSSDTLAALDWAITNPSDGAEILSNSWGCGNDAFTCADYESYCFSKGDGDATYSTLYLDAAVDYYDIISVNAAGNEGECGFYSLTPPADAYNVITIGAISDRGTTSRSDDTIVSYSSLGPTRDGRAKPDLVAPGSSITSANTGWEGLGSDFVSLSGTSMAAPHVSGAAALLKEYGLSSKGVKAVLINTAQDKGTSSWDAYYGWGEVDLNRAFTYKDYVINASLIEGSYVFYKVQQLLAGERATLTWNRHVVYAGATKPITKYGLNDLDLLIYKENDGILEDSSEYILDNVEQVTSPSEFLDGVVKVKAYIPDFTHGLNTESYALATEGGYTLATGPVLSITQVPSKATTQVNFTITATVTNLGDLKAHNVNATVILPSGLVLLSGNNSQSLGSIVAGNSSTATWIVNATGGPGTYTGVYYYVNSSSYGELFSNSTDASSVTVAAALPITCGSSVPRGCSSHDSVLTITNMSIGGSPRQGNNVTLQLNWTGWHFGDANYFAFFIDNSSTIVGSCRSYNDDVRYMAYTMNYSLLIPYNISPGKHALNVTANDFPGYCEPNENGVDTEASFELNIIDGVKPTINITTPQDNSRIATSASWFNLTTNENATCSYEIQTCDGDGGGGGGGCGSGMTLTTMSITGEKNHSQLVTGLSDTTSNEWKILTANCSDNAGNTNTNSVKFYVDTTPPVILLDSPLNKTYNWSRMQIDVSTTELVQFIRSSLDNAENVTLCEYCSAYNSTNLSGLSEGTHSLKISAADLANNSATLTAFFAIDATAPSINITSLANNSNFSRSSFWLNLTTSENASCSYTLQTCNTSFEGSSVRDALEEGEGHKYTLESIEYLILVAFVGSTSAKIEVNGEFTASLTENATYQFRDGTRITLIDARSQEFAGSTHEAEFLFNTSGRSDYCHGKRTADMISIGETQHYQLIDNFSDTSENQYNFLTAICNDTVLNSNGTSVRFYADMQAPLILNETIVFLNDTSIIIDWELSERVNRTFEYGLNTSYGRISEEFTRWKTPYVRLTGLSPVTTYHYLARFFDTFGNENASKGSFTTKQIEYVTQSITANETITISSPATNVTLSIVTKNDVANVSINITSSKDSPTGKSINVSGLKYLDIDADEALSRALSSVLLKIYYSDGELSAQNISESTLGIYWRNSTLDGWVKLSASLGWVFGTGVDEANNFVWANLSHFSSYAAGGLIVDGFACSSNSQCESGYCSNNICSNPPSEGSAPPSSSGGGGGGGGGGGSGGSDFRWQCTEWLACSPSGVQTRICTNVGVSLGILGKPAESQVCIYVAPKQSAAAAPTVLVPAAQVPASAPATAGPAAVAPAANRGGFGGITGRLISNLRKPGTRTGIIAVIAVICVVTGSLIFFKRRNQVITNI